MHNWSNCW